MRAHEAEKFFRLLFSSYLPNDHFSVVDSLHVHHEHTHTQKVRNPPVISTLVVCRSQLSPVPSAVTQREESPSIPTSSPHTHTPGSHLPSPVFAAHLSPKYETRASRNIPPPLNSHHHKTTSTTFPRPHSSSPSLPPLPVPHSRPLCWRPPLPPHITCTSSLYV